MQWLVRRLTNQAMGAFVGSGVGLDERGQLSLPDGLCPDRVHRFIELCMDTHFVSPRAAMSELFLCVGVKPPAVTLLDEIIAADGELDLKATTRHTTALLAALPELRQIPQHFRNFLVDDLHLASGACEDLEQAVVSARETAAARVGCEARWDAILEHEDPLRDMARPWRERIASSRAPA